MRKWAILSVVLTLLFGGCAASKPEPQAASRHETVESDKGHAERNLKTQFNKAQRIYLGKSIWKKSRTRLLSPTGENIKISNLEELKVVDIKVIGNCTKNTACWYLFRLSTKDGKNVLWRGHIFEKEGENYGSKGLNGGFYLQNPYNRHPEWSDEIWNKIRNQNIAVGMNQKMVRMSWGIPKNIQRTVDRFGIHEKWVYEGDVTGYLYFDNGTLIRYKSAPGNRSN